MSSTDLVPVAALLPTTLSRADRCDRCGAQAWTAVLTHGRPLGRLFFCAHHFTRWEFAIRRAAVAVLDLRWKLRADVDAQKQLRD